VPTAAQKRPATGNNTHRLSNTDVLGHVCSVLNISASGMFFGFAVLNIRVSVMFFLKLIS
jgi:hypothetical protein